MSSDNIYDIIIVGGGLAGLSCAIVLAGKKYKVLLLEKESYPKHKVCGEYISMESWPFLLSLGLPLDDMQLPVISKLTVTDTRGNEVNAVLPQGGFGISRYVLDKALAGLAEQAGATLVTKTKADDIQFENELFTVQAKGLAYTGKVVCGAWGKRGNMDVKWHRSFLKEKNTALNNYIGIKYHIRYPYPHDLIGLHNFTNGYCGISEIEDGKCCMAYLTTAANLHHSGNDIKKMEQDILMKNPVLKKIFTGAEFLYDAPVTISQISFQKKEQVHDHVLLLGDTAGMITPLCGNGMSMALHSAKIASGLIDDFLQSHISRAEMENHYTKTWKKNFAVRTTLGRIVQNSFGKDRRTAFFLKAVRLFPFLQKQLIRGTSGRPF
jgi:flavin-dependent dehydrogenase